MSGVNKKKNFDGLRRELAEKRDVLARRVRKILVEDRDAPIGDVGDVADVASGAFEKELLYELNDNERQMLEQIEYALKKIDHGTYGTCQICGKPIPATRLKAMPVARLCVPCQIRPATI